MSDQSNRIRHRTGGNANILSVLGDLLSADGNQAIRIPRGTHGQVLTVQDGAESGIGWTSLVGGDGLVAWAWINQSDGTIIDSSGNLDVAVVSQGIFNITTNDATEFTTCEVTGPLFDGVAPSVPAIPMLPLAGMTGPTSAQVRIVDRLGNPNATIGPFLVRFYL